MVKVEYRKLNDYSLDLNSELLKNKRNLTQAEIEILKKNNNTNKDSEWKNIFVDSQEGAFNPELIQFSSFEGLILLGKMQDVTLSYNDLHLTCGIYNSYVKNSFLGDYVCINNVKYLDNYKIGNRVILFNVFEICCTKHSKFGNGILKEGEEEKHRIWLGVGNENDGRRILPFNQMIPADAYIWSHYRDDPELLARFVELTEYGQSKALDTVGFIDDDCVIKNSQIVKDAKIGKATYIKGANKLKNITINSSEEEPTQIGEGVELVNGIVGYGCHIFYQAIAVRFVIGRNCQLKYGARLINSVLGDNSNISCCEVLNNLIYPFHEQHHNSSFLIATTIMGQSNIASGSTVGSNHNSRSADGELIAKRGFWPGLCSDFKHNSRFASFSLISKGSYQYELDIPYPFSLITPGANGDMAIHIIPAWWFMYDMFAISRNKNKFLKRDRRKVHLQEIETDPFAPDTMEEVLHAINRLINLTADYLEKNENPVMKGLKSPEEKFQAAKDYMHKNENADFTLFDSQCQKKYGSVIYKPVRAYKMYRKVMKYFATRTVMEYCTKLNMEHYSFDLVEKIRSIPLYEEWENVGGQIIPARKVRELFTLIKEKKINNWDQVHAFYQACQTNYEEYKVRYSLYLLEFLYSRPVTEFNQKLYKNIIDDVTEIQEDFYNAALASREKDYTDYYRTMVYRSKEEMDAVLGSLEENESLKNLKNLTEDFVQELHAFFSKMIVSN
ncbi:MAG: DUF4954 family protein [Treponema sp.]|nr:DUF4954 family protein [Treponema sp.]